MTQRPSGLEQVRTPRLGAGVNQHVHGAVARGVASMVASMSALAVLVAIGPANLAAASSEDGERNGCARMW